MRCDLVCIEHVNVQYWLTESGGIVRHRGYRVVCRVKAGWFSQKALTGVMSDLFLFWVGVFCERDELIYWQSAWCFSDTHSFWVISHPLVCSVDPSLITLSHGVSFHRSLSSRSTDCALIPSVAGSLNHSPACSRQQQLLSTRRRQRFQSWALYSMVSECQ